MTQDIDFNEILNAAQSGGHSPRAYVVEEVHKDGSSRYRSYHYLSSVMEDVRNIKASDHKRSTLNDIRVWLVPETRDEPIMLPGALY